MKAYTNIPVDQALRNRLVTLGSGNRKLYISFSGGKDSLVLVHSVECVIQQGKLDPKQVVVLFVDEEAIFPCVDRVVRKWREKVIEWGSTFLWLCMEFKHFNCFNMLAEEESFICWDHTKRDVWVRDKPDFAISHHPKFKFGQNYQTFLGQVTDGISVIGLRMDESVQRMNVILSSGGSPKNNYAVYPMYDFTENDVWLYLKKNNVDFPEVYEYMWKSGISRTKLRISQFFSIDTARSLVSLVQYYPGLYERILKREPNAYLALYYWDSEMFRRSTSRRRKLEGVSLTGAEWRDKLFVAMKDPRSVQNPRLFRGIKNFLLKWSAAATPEMYKRLYEAVVAGDPKGRALRAVFSAVNEGLQRGGYLKDG